MVALPRIGMLLSVACGGLFAFTAPAAQAQLAGGGADGLVSITSIPTTVEGRLAVDFASNPATGCAAPCDLNGRVVWTPSRDAELSIVEYRVAGKIETDVTLDFDDPVGDRPSTAADVTRGAGSGTPGHCQDASAARYASLDFNGDTPGTAVARLAAATHTVSYGADLLSTRCAGPLEGDIAAVLPTRTLPVAALRAGSTTIDLSATRAFAAAGMAGTVRSSIVLRVRRPRAFDLSSLGDFSRELARLLKPERIRILVATYDVERLSGDVVTTFDGSTQPELCRPLDACAVHGSVKVSHAVNAGEGLLYAIGPGRLTQRQLGAALGIYPGRRPGGVQTLGSVFWEKDPGRVASTVLDGSGRTCSDSAGLGEGLIALRFTRQRVTAAYGTGNLFDGDPLRSRCPGPAFADVVDGSEVVAQGSVARRSMRKRRVVLNLAQGSTFSSGAYTGRVQAGLSLGLRRVRVESSLLTVPGFAGLGR